MARTLDLQTTDDPSDAVHACVQTLVEGGVVCIPTETVYGLAASALNESAVEHLYKIKGRDDSSPIAISVPSRDAAEDFHCEVSGLARRLTHRCWPGPLTVAVPCPIDRSAVGQLPASVQSRIIGEHGCVGFRVADHRVVAHIHRFLAAPLLLTSANLSGAKNVCEAGSIDSSVLDQVPLLLDDGPTRYGGPSTVARVLGNRMKILREGVIERAAMNQFVKPVIAVVCTGNTCRSPMAETLFREKLSQKLGCEDAVRVLSAGVAAAAGSGASPQAVEVMGNRGLDLTGHASRPLDESVMNVADLVLTLTRGHRAAILAAWPNMHDRVFTLRRDGGDVSDPVGMPTEVYEQCAQQIESELDSWIEALEDDFLPQVDDN